MVAMRQILFNSVTISLPKNVVQFSLGAILYWFIIGNPCPYMVLLSVSGFLIAYSSVYLYNDAVDQDEDKKDSEKVKWKLVAGGHLDADKANVLALFFAGLGLGLSLIVNRWFFFMVVGMLFLNFLHSSPHTRFKKSMRKTSVNMTLIEFLKFSCGWFALTTNIVDFPFWIVLTFSIVYTTSYLIYKFRFKGLNLKNNKKIFASLAIAGSFSYIMSLIYYPFPLSMLLLIVIPLFIIFLFKQMDMRFHKINNMILIEYILLPVVIISFLLITTPLFGQTNEQMASTIDAYRSEIAEDMPEDVIGPIENLTDELKKYKTLEDVESDLKEGIENLTD